MAQALEWQPRGCITTPSSAPAPPPAPSKLLLSRCTATHFLAAVTAALDALPSGRVLLVYLSADRALPTDEADTAKSVDMRDATPQERVAQLPEANLLLFPASQGGEAITSPSRAGAEADGAAALPHTASLAAMPPAGSATLQPIVRPTAEVDRVSTASPPSAVTGSVAEPRAPLSASAMLNTSEGVAAHPVVSSDDDDVSTATAAPASLPPFAASPAQGAAASDSPAAAAAVVTAQQVLLPSDLLGLTRKRLFLIIDSNAAPHFAELAEQPLVYTPLLLLSPPCARLRETDAARAEQLFTLFLTDPLLALVRATGCLATPALLAEVTHLLDGALAAADGELTVAAASPAWAHVLLDPFARRLLTRFALCRAVLARLQGAADVVELSGLPTALPELPAALAPEGGCLDTAVPPLLALLSAGVPQASIVA